MKKLSVAYFGTPDFSARFLEKILEDKELPVEIKLVVTQSDKKVGRKQMLTKSPVKVVAEKHDIPVILGSGATPGSGRFWTSQNDTEGIDLALLFAYGEIIPKELLTVPKYGFWNIHPSLLPKYRGASPVAFPLINGDRETGVTLMQMDEKMDTGPIIGQEKVQILPKERRDELTNRLTDAAFEMFKNVILNGSEGSDINWILRSTQNDKEATYTKLLTKQDGFIDFTTLKEKINSSPTEIFNKFRGLYPWPGVWTEVDINGEKKRLKITDMDFGSGKLMLLKVQLEGKNETDFKQFNKVYKLFKA